jgi:hypothetical protein
MLRIVNNALYGTEYRTESHGGRKHEKQQQTSAKHLRSPAGHAELSPDAKRDHRIQAQ